MLLLPDESCYDLNKEDSLIRSMLSHLTNDENQDKYFIVMPAGFGLLRPVVKHEPYFRVH